jgi:hypothetical protein
MAPPLADFSAGGGMPKGSDLEFNRLAIQPSPVNPYSLSHQAL